MSKIKYLDFAKSVDLSRESLKDILKNKGVNVAENQSLQTYVNNVIELPDKADKPDYIPDPYFAAFDKYYETDPLLKKNGGIYTDARYAVLYCTYDTTYIRVSISSSVTTKIYTSDGQEITPTTSNVNITWDKTKDGQTTLFDIPDQLQNGAKVRWIRIYSTARLYEYPCYPTNSTSNSSALVYYLAYSNNAYATFCSSSGKDAMALNNCYNLKYLTLSAPNANINKTNMTSTAILYYIYNCYSLECINNLQELQIAASSGAADSLYALKKINKTIYPSTESIKPMSYLAEIVTIKSQWNNYSLNMNMDKVKHLIFAESVDYDRCQIYPNSNLEILEFQKSLGRTTLSVTGGGCSNLHSIIIPEDFLAGSIDISGAGNLTKASVLQMMNNLKDLSAETARTLTLSIPTFASLSNEEKAIAINKNWTLSFK